MCLRKEQFSKWMEGIHDFQEFESANKSCTLVLYIWQNQTHWANARRNAKCTFKNLNWRRNARRKDEKSAKYGYNVTYFIVWLAPAKWTKSRTGNYLARSGYRLFHRKKGIDHFFWGVLSHTINPLLTKLFRSRWLDISLVHFLRVWGPRLCFGP